MGAVCSNEQQQDQFISPRSRAANTASKNTAASEPSDNAPVKAPVKASSEHGETEAATATTEPAAEAAAAGEEDTTGLTPEEMAQLDNLRAENDRLQREVATLQARLQQEQGSKGLALVSSGGTTEWDLSTQDESALKQGALSIVVVGASGDLAVKKTYPALFSLFQQGLLPPLVSIVGYARSALELADFRKRISAKFPKSSKPDLVHNFLALCTYVAGQYDSDADFARLDQALKQNESNLSPSGVGNRIFYFAIPPNVFIPTSTSIRNKAMSKSGWNRVIVEKPFGHDTASAAQMNRDLSALFTEEQIFRIDHYLGKEMVQNLMVLRFSNKVFEPIWNRQHISCVQITFKEDFGTQGRGGYFDNFGIIRDVMQNHLLQILSLVAMEPPVSLSAEDVRDEKVKLLRCIRPIVRQDLVIGQYGADPKGKEGSYLDDPTVPKSSVTPTYACAILWIDNERWAGTPFILKCGKALNERKADIRIQFRTPANKLFTDLSNNELVLRVQPDEAVYLKMTAKQPGLEGGLRHTELDLSYKARFGEVARQLPDAYERLIFDVVRNDHNLFVRADELVAAWNIFTPILHLLAEQKVKPLVYQYGSRGPAEADAMISRVGFVRTDKYSWNPEPAKL